MNERPPADDLPEVVEGDRLPDRASIHLVGWQGPLPDPAALRAYDSVVVNGAERIFRLTESEVEHRHAMERAMLAEHTRFRTRGQIAGIVIVMAVLLLGAYAIHEGAELVGLGFVATAIAGVIIALVLGEMPTSKRATPDDFDSIDDDE